MRNWILEISSIKGGQDNSTALQRQSILPGRGKKRSVFLSAADKMSELVRFLIYLYMSSACIMNSQFHLKNFHFSIPEDAQKHHLQTYAVSIVACVSMFPRSLHLLLLFLFPLGFLLPNLPCSAQAISSMCFPITTCADLSSSYRLLLTPTITVSLACTVAAYLKDPIMRGDSESKESMRAGWRAAEYKVQSLKSQ